MNTVNCIDNKHLLFALVAFLTCCGGGLAEERAEKPKSVSSEVGDFTLRDVDGRTHSLSDYLGEKVIAISFFATWCEPCKKEIVTLNDIYKTHKDKGLVILLISMDEPETQGDVRSLVKQRGVEFPVLLDSESQVTGRINPRRAAPYGLILDRAGKVVWTHEGFVPGDEAKLEAAVVDALGAE